MSRAAILYGFSEGPAHAWRLRLCLEQAGLALTTDVQAAQVIITHSAGSFFLPENLQDKTVIIFNPVCGTPRVLPKVMTQKIW